MNQKIKSLAVYLSSFFILTVPLALSSSVGAAAKTPADYSQTNINSKVCTGTKGQFSSSSTATTGFDCTNGESSIHNLITTTLNILSIVVGIIAVIMIIVAGLKYVTSGGKDEGVKSAKNTILYAVIGLVIVALAQIIVHFVLNTTNSQIGG